MSAKRRLSAVEINRIAQRSYGGAPNRATRRAMAKVRTSGLDWKRDNQRVQLGDDGVGYYADAGLTDDCFRAAIATATQIPIREVLDLRLHCRLAEGEDPDEINVDSWQRIARWLAGRGLQLTRHDSVPVDRERWVGVCTCPPDLVEELTAPRLVRGKPWTNPFIDHCLVMSYDRVVFDPAANAHAPEGMRPRPWQSTDVTYGLSFDPKGVNDGN